MSILRTPEDRFSDLSDFPFEPHYVEIDDPTHGALRMHYLDEGDHAAPIVLLLHGQGTWSYLYRKMIPILVDAGYRVIAPDYVGFGRSDKLPNSDDYTYQKNVDWLASFVKVMQLQGVTGFFFDWGGMFGLRVAADNPGAFARLVLLNTTLPRGNKLLSNLWVLGWRRYCAKQPQFPMGTMVNNMTAQDVPVDVIAGFDAPYPDEGYKAGPSKLPRLIPASPWHEASAPNTKAWKDLEHWDKPVLTLFSEQLAKRGIKPDEFQQRIPGAAGQSHALIPNAGFFIVEDQPEILSEKLIAFIRATS